MRTRRLGRSDLEVSEIGLGAMSLGRDERAASELIQRAIDLGVTFIDTADLYHQGLNEELVGRALRSVRERVVIATKVGNRWRRDGSGWDWDPSPEHIRRSVHQSLRRLGVDVIDLYQLHGGTIDDPIDETIAAFEELKREGWIRHYGLSSIRPNVIREYARRSNVVSVMMQYSLLDRRPEEEALELLHQQGIGVIARGPVAKGLLAGKPAEPYLDHSQDEVAAAQQALVAAAAGRGLAPLALRFVLAHPAVTTVIPGARTVAQLEDNLAAAALPELPDVFAELRRRVPAHRYRAHR